MIICVFLCYGCVLMLWLFILEVDCIGETIWDLNGPVTDPEMFGIVLEVSASYGAHRVTFCGV